jgi:hypothetical protein
MNNPKLIYNFPIKIFFIDWDDTLFNTSELYTHSKINNIHPLKNNLRCFSSLDDSIYKFLSFLIKKGDVYIISNASKIWILDSCKNYLPKTFKLFDFLNIYSAYDHYIKNNEFEGTLFKYFLMKKILIKYQHKNITILNIGDSDYEKDACINLMKNKSKNLLHISIIKLKENPNTQTIISQLSNIIFNFDKYITKDNIVYL